MAFDREELKQKAQNKAKENKAFLAKLKKKRPKSLDEEAQQLHHEVFSYTDCLGCANCCKSISPIVTNRDVDRLANHLRLRPREVIEQYLVLDDDNDYIFRETPCPFLMPDNYCMVYSARPRACREYPHTDRKRLYQITTLTYKNTFICPAAFDVVEGLKPIFDK
ncbi:MULTISPECIES: YkgJ family cysteine cluster protein [unclassified Carboxylicivirga]|uniref:YkgJ family cysteine cluster protein n=1 Tax=Carboxylicivirga TaxID=1628153 RepID=UPI003D32F61D